MNEEWTFESEAANLYRPETTEADIRHALKKVFMAGRKGPYHPVSFDEVCGRFMAEIRINGKRLEQLESVISPLLARAHCECSDDEAQALIRNATEAAEKVGKDFGGLAHLRENFQIWLDYQRKKERI